jgi:AraC-like DNA-binding protein
MHLMTASPVLNVPISYTNRMDHNARIATAITELESQNRPNIAATARKWKIARETLSKRFRGTTGSNQDATSYSRKRLTDIQEETLIAYINKSNDRGFPPTPQILKNIAESIAHTPLGPNWVARFCKRYRTRLASVYLRTIDHKRKEKNTTNSLEQNFERVISVILTSKPRLS